MFKLRNKLNKKGGFTLIEMLIVVAIIAILIAVSIPLIGSALEKARQATDAANERAARAEITIAYMTGEIDDTNKLEFDDPDGTRKQYVYDAQDGKLLPLATTSPTVKYGKCEDHDGGYIKVGITINGDVDIEWFDASGNGITGDLCGKKLNS